MKKIFTNDKFFLAMVLCAVIGNAAFIVLSKVLYNASIISKLQLILYVLCAIGLYISYTRHSKNVMKGMMGALLMAQLSTATGLLSKISFPIEKITISLCAVFSYAVFSLILLVNHYIINSDHHSNSAMVRVNQIILILLVINQVIWSAYFVISEFSVLVLINGLCNVLGYVGLSSIVVCVESRLDAYRLDREAAGWTEEKGYPENYVHQYEKK